MKSVFAPQLRVINTTRWSANFSSNADNNAALQAELQQAKNHVQRLSIENCQVREQLLQAQEVQKRDHAELVALKHHLENVGKELERERLALLAAVQSLAEAQSNQVQLKLEHSVVVDSLSEQLGKMKEQIKEQREHLELAQRQLRQSDAGNPAFSLPGSPSSSHRSNEAPFAPFEPEIDCLSSPPFASSYPRSDAVECPPAASAVSAVSSPQLPQRIVPQAPPGAALQVSHLCTPSLVNHPLIKSNGCCVLTDRLCWLQRLLCLEPATFGGRAAGRPEVPSPRFFLTASPQEL
jgi:hypothetical protein